MKNEYIGYKTGNLDDETIVMRATGRTSEGHKFFILAPITEEFAADPLACEAWARHLIEDLDPAILGPYPEAT